MPSANSFRGWCGGTPPPLSFSAARSRSGGSAAGPATATVTADRIRHRMRPFKALLKRNASAASRSTSITHHIRFGITVIGLVSLLAAMTGIWSTWHDGRKTSVPYYLPLNGLSRRHTKDENHHYQ